MHNNYTCMWGFLLLFLFCLYEVLRSIREFFTHTKTSPGLSEVPQCFVFTAVAGGVLHHVNVYYDT